MQQETDVDITCNPSQGPPVSLLLTCVYLIVCTFITRVDSCDTNTCASLLQSQTPLPPTNLFYDLFIFKNAV